jgi:cellulose synthase/poly-beta-1,6-N-acetylglucosamine synthase-like glycosyltransferase
MTPRRSLPRIQRMIGPRTTAPAAPGQTMQPQSSPLPFPRPVRPSEQVSSADQPAPHLSVIIACHGESPDLLEQQLESLAAQQTPWLWELLIADNGTGPITHQVLDRFAARMPALRVIPAARRRGKGYAVNTAVQQAASPRLVLLDSDDVVMPGYLLAMAQALDEHHFVGGRMDSAALNPSWLRDRRGDLQADGLQRLLDDSHLTVIGAAMAMTREAFDLAGGFDEDLETQEDLDMSWRLHQAGIDAHYAPDAVMLYRYRRDLGSVLTQERQYGRGAAQLYALRRRQGVAGRSPKRTVKGWLDVVLAVPWVFTQAGRARFVTVLGAALGRLEGSLRYGVRYL